MTAAVAPDRYALAASHLRLRLAVVNRALRAAVARRAAISAGLDRPDLAAVCVTDRQVHVLLDHVDAATSAERGPAPPAAPPLDPAEAELRETAARHGLTLPLDELAGHFGLSPAETDAVLLVAAAELDPAYERIYGYVLDDLGRQLPCVQLLAEAGATGPADALRRRQWLGRTGTLRRTGLLIDAGAAPTEARQQLTPAPGLLDFLLGHPADLPTIAADPGAFDPPPTAPLGLGVDPERLARAAAALAGGGIQVVAVWQPGDAAPLVAELARRAGLPVRRLDAGTLPATAVVRAALRTAKATGAILWVNVPESDGPASERAETVLAAELAASTVPVCLTGPAPWRPPELLARRPTIELEFLVPGHTERVAMWQATAPHARPADLDRLAARFRLGGQDLAAVAALAHAEAYAANGDRPAVEVRLERAAAMVSQRRTSRLAVTVHPRRSADELILPPGELRQVLEVASFFDAWPRVAERWGFAGRAGGRGLKVLFTGEPGTGKTLAAEVIAARLGLSLVTTDLSRMVSKWVGETEKNLDTVFAEAAASNAVLFFDEADALFGKRGQVEHGTDRWANLEVGYLLQRLESFDGLVILASNLRDNIDPAFTRRFSVVVHFPRPQQDARERLWRHAFPPEAPLADVDLPALATLDLTGAGIVAAARTAALLAADAGATAITMTHVVHGISRQYQREARMLRPTDLGRYAPLLDPGHG
ncbi:ATP-binding protein [Nonomuraea sp. NPDC050153]|uniref:ATP-binding protein n=1 Tax=Nonomuraea sp. NPDC050153 TaxID=3364359 RepID=UPI0037B7E842